jgi:N-acetylmuramoyl-L-alanine amidase
LLSFSPINNLITDGGFFCVSTSLGTTKSSYSALIRSAEVVVALGGACSPDAHRVVFKGDIMKIGICAGHGRLGAVQTRIWEMDRCVPALSQAFAMLKSAGINVVTPNPSIYDLDNDDALVKKVEFFNEENCDLSVEIHINAGKGNYSTCLYWDKGEKHSIVGKEVASEIEKQFESVTTWKSIGAKPQSYFSRGLYFLNKTNHPSVITEIGFKDTQIHVDWLLRRSGDILHGSSIAQALIVYAQKGLR